MQTLDSAVIQPSPSHQHPVAIYLVLTPIPGATIPISDVATKALNTIHGMLREYGLDITRTRGEEFGRVGAPVIYPMDPDTAGSLAAVMIDDTDRRGVAFEFSGIAASILTDHLHAYTQRVRRELCATADLFASGSER